MKSNFYILLTWSLICMSCSRATDRSEALPTVSVNPATTLQDVALQKKAAEEMKTMSKAPSNDKDFWARENMPISEKTRQIIRTANLIHEVKSNKDYNRYVRKLLNKYNAYIFKEDNNAADNNGQTTMVIKVPVELFDSLITELAPTEVKQLQKNISSEDITSEVIDTRARLETRKATRDKYLEFLSKASKIEDVLKIQQEINNIQEDIESAEALLARLSGQARYSTINLTYFEPNSGNENYNVNTGFWSRTGKAIKNGASMLSEIFIAFVSAWPIWIIMILIIFIVKRSRRRWRSEKRNP
ncbi:DUF4349 domain-containing protein [Niabella sp. CJ426]|uniref:DUF4349 domain-containing protein n=1 Tax=Niabella sp. CJ426 TaxID=3393740 RepID=UPI003D012934